jgi:hypothetical protein
MAFMDNSVVLYVYQNNAGGKSNIRKVMGVKIKSKEYKQRPFWLCPF